MPGNKIDQRSTVPLGWISFAIAGAWVTAMVFYSLQTDVRELKADVRLIKKKLHIEDRETATNGVIFDNAEAGTQ